MTKKVIVLGAGASHDYGFPTGEELIIKIDEILETINTNKTPAIYKQFKDHFKKFKPKSIDEYLSLTQDIELRKLGKKLILLAIRNCEDVNLFGKNKSWYSYLTQLFLPIYYGDEKKGYEVFISNLANLQVITFNYDVSLEYFIFSQIDRDYFSKDELKKNAKEEISKKIVHVYGQVWRGENILKSYGSVKIPDARNSPINDAVDQQNEDSIKVIYEERTSQYENIKNAVYGTDELYILGFGFDKNNCIDILGLNSFSEKHDNKKNECPRVFCTNYSNTNIINRKIQCYFKNIETIISAKEMIETMRTEFDFDNHYIATKAKGSFFA